MRRLLIPVAAFMGRLRRALTADARLRADLKRLHAAFDLAEVEPPTATDKNQPTTDGGKHA